MTRTAELPRFLPAPVVLVVLLAAGCASGGRGIAVTERPQRPENIVTEAPVEPRETAVERDRSPVDVEVGRFDGGKMWTFENPPVEYFRETYGVPADPEWFQRARLGALRFSTFCSASFVSPSGLIMTNHHCARTGVTEVERTGESLLDTGFIARSTRDEREVKDLYVEQLVDVTDVTGRIYGAVLEVPGAEPPVETRRRRADAVEARMQSEAAASDSSLHVEVLPLYDGGKYVAYTFKRYKDVRLVFAPELEIGFFGGEHDNFTYPRYNLDVSFFRAYDREGRPLATPDYYRWSTDGVAAGDAVFVVGNPGSTSRLTTVAQLEYFRDVALPRSIDILADRARILREYVDTHPEQADSFDVINDLFSIQNSLKAERGELEGLREGSLIARRRAAQDSLQESVEAEDSLQTLYGSAVGDIERLQVAKEVSSRSAAAFTHFLNPSASSHILTRALYGYAYEILRQRGAPPMQLRDIRTEALEIGDWPRELERRIIAARIRDFEAALGPSDPTVRRLLSGGTPESIADSIASHSELADSSRFREMLDDNYLGSGDVTVSIINAIAPLYFTVDDQLRSLVEREEIFSARLARARFAVYGETMPPDASFSPRIADGVVAGYEYNGTVAPAFTTFYGLYDKARSHANQEEWVLPQRWTDPPPEFDYKTPFNLVSTNDITGGNSGSPLLNAELEIVGLVFDGNMESLPNEFLYTDVRARTISVDARGILEALDDIYDNDRILLEIVTGNLYETEEEADGAAASGR